jgi:hypothetical protein
LPRGIIARFSTGDEPNLPNPDRRWGFGLVHDNKNLKELDEEIYNDKRFFGLLEWQEAPYGNIKYLLVWESDVDAILSELESRLATEGEKI